MPRLGAARTVAPMTATHPTSAARLAEGTLEHTAHPDVLGDGDRKPVAGNRTVGSVEDDWATVL
jgi:hypothetical protein